MSFRKLGTLVVCLTALSAAMGAHGADAQTPAGAVPAVSSPEIEGGTPHYIRPETPEQRRERIGTAEDPGLNPDPSTVFWRYGKEFTIAKVDRKDAKYMQDGWVRPTAWMNFVHEIYQENDKYIWVWIEKLPVPTGEEAESQAEFREYSPESIEFFEYLRGEFVPVETPVANTKVRFEESSAGLPTSGSWRNGPAVGDMNGDGFADLVLPPQRGMAATPSIYLGDGKGGWTRWSDAKWNTPGFNYGTAAVGDFNNDRKLDVAFGVHLTGVMIFLGDGKGNFTRVIDGLDADYPTRRIVVTDVDRDGWSDVVAISEGPVGRLEGRKNEKHGNVLAYMNRGKGRKWEAVNIAQPKQYIGSDWLSVGDFNGDKYPDFVGGTIYFNSTHLVYLSKAAKQYEVFADAYGKKIVPRAYYYGNATGKFSGGKQDEAIVGYYRTWPTTLNPKLVPPPAFTKVSGFDRLTFVNGDVVRTPIVRWSGAERLLGVADGDFNRDGNLDFAYTRYEPRQLVMLLGDGKGGFSRATVEGVELSGLRNYDLTVSDVNGDKLPDLVVMYEAQEATAFSPKKGKVQVFLNRGSEALSAKTAEAGKGTN